MKVRKGRFNIKYKPVSEPFKRKLDEVFYPEECDRAETPDFKRCANCLGQLPLGQICLNVVLDVGHIEQVSDKEEFDRIDSF